ncbi:baseplate J/gp47 family protein [Sphingosinicella sp. BN140058]|uniref:baseplate J/gp47 family protein n=1 Tax=Sphingosinicella sp. BN140058 TaxID=1892855 RepID=UPI0010131127|nr:baseplate J/gp47 family protein [Sphingosinicella sp. BN140058]QAY79324.1 hypothetical protein ETR14_24365 [Sphingosinicella sp. BN140058]
MSAPLDGRRAHALLEDMLRRARIALPRDGQPAEPGEVTRAILDAAARIGEEVTLRLDRVPDKQADNFYTAMGLGRDPARPAKLPVAFELAERATAGLLAPAGTRLSVDGPDGPVVFETEHGIELVQHRIAALAAVDAADDTIFLAAKSVVAGKLPRSAPLRRMVRGDVGAGAAKIQLDPALGLEAGMTLRLGTAADAPEHDVVAVEGDLVTLTPLLGAALADGSAVSEVISFAPFAVGARNRQAHALYLGHPTLLDIAAEATIGVTGLSLPAEAAWSWWGKLEGDDAAGWHPLRATTLGSGLALAKAKGAPEEREVGGRTSFWIRAALPGPSASAARAQEVRISVSGSGRCGVPHGQRCSIAADSQPIGYEAIAVTTPIVPNQPYHPFGREPRIFDSFYIGSKEVFGKAGAEVDLCITLGGPKFGRLASVEGGGILQVFGVGADGLVYRASFGSGIARLDPLPREGDPLPAYAAISAVLVGFHVHLFVGRENGVERAVFPFFISDVTRDMVSWTSIEPATPIGAVGAIVAFPLDSPVFYALAGTGLLEGRVAEQGYALHPIETDAPVQRLVRIQATGAALVVEGESDAPVTLWRAWPDTEWQELSSGRTWPLERLACWEHPDSGGTFMVGGFDRTGDEDRWQVVFHQLESGDAPVPIPVDEADVEPAEITFEWSNVVEGIPSAMIATTTPRQLIPVARTGGVEFVTVEEPEQIGAGGGDGRAFVLGGARTVIPRADLGLLHRAGSGRVIKMAVTARLTLAPEAIFPNRSGVYATPEDNSDRSNGEAYAWEQSDGGRFRRLMPMRPFAGVPSPLGHVDFWTLDLSQKLDLQIKWTGVTDGEEEEGDPRAIVQISPEDPFPAATTALTILTADPGLPAPSDFGIWDLVKTFDAPLEEPDADAEPATAFWTALESFPQTEAPLPFSLLKPADVSGAFEAMTFADPATIEERLRQGPLTVLGTDRRLLTLEAFSPNVLMARLSHDLIGLDEAVDFVTAPAPWSFVGPDQPSNPALSWEYWNGRSWWALEWGDTTGNLQSDGGIFFRVPKDLEETEVGGRKNRWIRARLVGGDYGEARVTVTTIPAGAGQQQSVTRDLSAIRAPYIIALRMGYCVTEPARPETILTEDNLGIIERTGANDVDLPFPVFTPVREAMNPPAAPQPPAPDLECDLCREDAQPDAPEPSGPAGEDPPSAPAERSLLIGFERPVTAMPITLFLDVAPLGGSGAFTAHVLRGGRFEPVEIGTDTSRAAGEPGIVSLFVAAPPDRATLFGTEAHWLRLGVAGQWSPQLNAVHPNAVMALSVDSRRNESVGSSSGAPDQSFRLAAASVEETSLQLFVQEDVGEEEAQSLETSPQIEGRPGPWVRWQAVPDVRDRGPFERIFALDSEQGTIRFGDGVRGRIPPAGKPLVAVAYRHVTGTGGNHVAAGDVLTPISPLAGVDKVAALDASAGGSDVEGIDAARRRAPAKLRHGGRIVTLADIEEFVRARFPQLVQARAQPWRGGVRLVVVERSAPPPLPATLREIAAAVREVASYGLAAPGRLTVAGARLLPVGVTVSLIPDDPDRFADLAAEVRTALAALFDPATGGLAGTGWPLGARPGKVDIAAALAGLADRAILSEIALDRRDRAQAEPLPERFPADVLATLSRDAVIVRPAQEVAA